MSSVTGSNPQQPYKIACLCDLRDARGRVLLLKRTKPPNLGMYSPIGGKLDVVSGESPAACARREILEEAGIDVPIERIRLIGMVSEQSYEGHGHWLMFVYRVLGAVEVKPRDMAEGRLDWHDPEDLETLSVPESDRRVIWPLIKRATPRAVGDMPGFFAVHIDCRHGGMTHVLEQEMPPGGARS